jgi:hydrogenase maturation protease
MMGGGRTLLIGFGNPGRGDDGLGPALAEAVELLGLPGVTVETDYQLSAEHAVAVNEADAVVFADAAVAGPEPWAFSRIEPVDDLPWSTHGLEPPALLALARHVSGRSGRDRRVAAYLLALRGYAFDEFSEKLSERAQRNLADAVAFLAAALRGGELEAAADRAVARSDATVTTSGDGT